MDEYVIFWFRRDLRLEDNHGFYRALTSGYKVIPIFVFDPAILVEFSDKSNRQVNFITNAIRRLNEEFLKLGGSLLIYHQKPEDVFQMLAKLYSIKGVYFNEDYEPKAIQRDINIEKELSSLAIPVFKFTDQVIHRPGLILKSDHTPYTIYTPFSKQWKLALTQDSFQNYPSENNLNMLASIQNVDTFDFNTLNFKTSLRGIDFDFPEEIIKNYHLTRDIPSLENGTTHIGIHLRFGTVSVRKIASLATSLNEQFLNELIWREFFMHILFHFPHVVNGAFKPKYNAIEWRNNEEEFESWCGGNTGIPMVDAGMRELNSTGFMHNRVRMVVASYLTKHLLIDWRWGEAYFAQHLVDFELASNNGNWQWAAGSGCDAAPYFRIFNPYRQQERFDLNFEYIKHWVPEFQSISYQKLLKNDLVNAKSRCLIAYKNALI